MTPDPRATAAADVARRTVVARLDSLGDVLLAGPAVRAVAAGSEQLTLLCGPRGAAAARLLPGVDRTLVWDAPWISSPAPRVSGRSWRRLIRSLRRARADAAVILTSFHQSPLPLALAMRLAGIRSITAASVDYAGDLLDVRIVPGEDLPEDLPEPERALRIAASAGFVLPAGDDGRLRVRSTAEAATGLPPEPYIVVHPGASVPARRWPAASHAALVDELHRLGHRVVVTGGDDERALTAAVAGRHGIDLGGGTGLARLAEIVRRAEVVVAGNTGPAHLAAAVGTPVVSLYSPVLPAVRWAPYGVPTVLLGDQRAACRGSRARVCPIAGHPCLASVTPTEVVEACESLLAGSERRTEVEA